MTQDFPRTKVFTALALGLISFGFAPILVRFAPDTPAVVLAAWRTLIAVALLIPYWLYARSRKPVFDTRKEMWLTLLAGVSLGLHFIFWISSLYYTTVASASVLVTTHPIMLIAVERLFLKRSFAGTTWIGVFIAFAGSVLLGVSDSRAGESLNVPDPLLGNLLAFTAAAIFVVYILIGQRIRQKLEWIDYTFPVYGSAALTCLAITWLMGNSLGDVSTVGLAVGFGLALGPQLMGHGSMNYAVKYVSPTLLSTLILVEPLFATAAAYLLFSEFPPAVSLAAMIIVLAGVGLTWKRKARPPSEISAEHPE